MATFKGTCVEEFEMVVRSTQLFAASVAIATCVVGAQAATAQQVDPRFYDYPTVQEQITDTFFGEAGDFYRNSGWLGTATTFIGPFPENTIRRDAQATNELYEELLAIQTTSDPTLRTVDLSNPFDTSLRLLPPYVAPVPGPRPAFIPAIQPASPAPATRPTPVRGLY